MVAPTAEKAYVKNAWVILFVLGLISTVGGIAFVAQGGRGRAEVLKYLTGLTWDELLTRVPGIGSFLAEVQTVLDTYEVGFGIAVMAISWFSYRKGERWAWYALWIVPLVVLSITLNDVRAGMSLSGFLGIPLLALSLLGLLLPYRKFFPGKP